MWKIKKETIESILMAASNTYPDEFFALLGGNAEKKLVYELVVVPAVYGKTHALVKTHLIPFDPSVVGSVHSHPSVYSKPSRTDLISFSKFGELHLIVAYPFDLNTIKAFNVNGKTEKIEII